MKRTIVTIFPMIGVGSAAGWYAWASDSTMWFLAFGELTWRQVGIPPLPQDDEGAPA